MAKVLIVDDDEIAIETLCTVLTLAGHEPAAAANGRAGVETAEAFQPDVALIDLVLPDCSGLEVTSTILMRLPWVACVVVTGYWSRETMQSALRVGACDWVDKPASDTEVLTAVRRALIGRPSRSFLTIVGAPAQPHAVTRLAEAAVRFIGHSSDCPNLRSLGRAVGHAPGCIYNWCHTARLTASAFRDFTRALRAVYRLERSRHASDTNMLTIVDQRTLTRFRSRCGSSGTSLPATVNDFLQHQRFITERPFVSMVRSLLSHTRVLLEPSEDE